ncbi:MAG: hypothetical protein Q4C69_11005 [Lachnoclostridium edouardi]|uniref:hypothetical protein n=1 Tax=Lachnoclostridium edouardi TaxID=1926283 RepID=UPI0026DC3391|nr:hypothetical protein [Lachnoclostridium edouardi]MDO4279346.1 hypothetical protein [Lachnoclostridium edouardi]
MELIHFQGLNCYHDCIVTLANAFGLDYTKAFSTLWSEGNLRYDLICQVFLTCRMPDTLEAMGMKLESPCILMSDKENGFENTQNGCYIIVGMDAYHIPWNPLYKLHHGPHYFIAEKGDGEQQICFDPTYGLYGQKYSAHLLVSLSYALIPVKKIKASPAFLEETTDLSDQALEVLKTHKKTLDHFFGQAKIWIGGSEDTRVLPAKYIDGLMTGRYMYKQFLKARQIEPDNAGLFYSRSYYSQWQAVKSGFYKAALKNKDKAAYDEACSLLVRLFDQEILLAKQILNM